MICSGAFLWKALPFLSWEVNRVHAGLSVKLMSPNIRSQKWSFEPLNHIIKWNVLSANWMWLQNPHRTASRCFQRSRVIENTFLFVELSDETALKQKPWCCMQSGWGKWCTCNLKDGNVGALGLFSVWLIRRLTLKTTCIHARVQLVLEKMQYVFKRRRRSHKAYTQYPLPF